MVDIHPQAIKGLWRFGIALDLHTTSSAPIGPSEAGHLQFDTVRPEIAQLLYRLKYRSDQRAAQGIIQAAAKFLRPHLGKFEMIVPVPPSTVRKIQPVLILAQGIGTALSVPMIDCIATTRPATQLKRVTDPATRKALVNGLYTVDPVQTANKSILLFDDLFRSGVTMNAATEVLLQHGRASEVRALTITKTRSNQ